MYDSLGENFNLNYDLKRKKKQLQEILFNFCNQYN